MNKRILISIIAIAVLAGGVGFAMWQIQPYKTGNEELTEEQIIVDSKTSEDETSRPEKEPDGEVKRPATVDPNEEPPRQPEAGHSITINSWGYSNNEVYVNAMADNAANGTCTLTLSENGRTVTGTASLQKAPTGYHACALRVGRSRIPSAGTWKAQVTLSNNAGSSKSQTVEVKVK